MNRQLVEVRWNPKNIESIQNKAGKMKTENTPTKMIDF